jgi:guanosine-3',5'-bis(diphosphate) 3'-pyrophosphohydrolase
VNTINLLLKAASFAAFKHRNQKRKGADGVPYINHPLEVADILAGVGQINDTGVLSAAILHDTIEDTDATKEEIETIFGAEICAYVLEVSDDKSLPKPERKRLQIEHAPHISDGAKQIKLADKICNVRDVTENPPDWWETERRVAYIRWSEAVVDGLRGVNSNLDELFDEKLAKAEASFGME